MPRAGGSYAGPAEIVDDQPLQIDVVAGLDQLRPDAACIDHALANPGHLDGLCIQCQRQIHASGGAQRGCQVRRRIDVKGLRRQIRKQPRPLGPDGTRVNQCACQHRAVEPDAQIPPGNADARHFCMAGNIDCPEWQQPQPRGGLGCQRREPVSQPPRIFAGHLDIPFETGGRARLERAIQRQEASSRTGSRQFQVHRLAAPYVHRRGGISQGLAAKRHNWRRKRGIQGKRQAPGSLGIDDEILHRSYQRSGCR